MRIFAYRPAPGAPLRYRALKMNAFYEAREASKSCKGVVEVIKISVKPNLTKAMLIEECLNGANWGTGDSEVIGRFEDGKQIKEPVAA
ncbi:hypothetical protein [Methylorubrum extorquens]|uniref:hypothetical protein n=1 Tax=Methylorubrum extorquens TaxID=408 RepID=UPI0020A1DA84|nr:hypothetical protein [Methylorubrum extorquens]MCP1539979.1 hypothetical protein [Methylorubrum extorquens]